ncbi:hypothetical protein K7X08_011026 [Anisodus acutangulus]|uniref:glutathione transferase n=1 Tax=Anisodus acutangulus TaxID=402998 RepID=A0A9Q1LZW3_9SOLA|nr:hypothetical protein K7X08_011026 [Anisodus acutangulus]
MQQVKLIYPEIMAIKVHGNPMSTATMRVAAYLIEKDLDFDSLSNSRKSVSLPREKRSFEDGDLKHFESRAITQYIVHVYSSNGYQLVLQDPKKMAIMSVWMEVEGQRFESPPSKLTWELCIKPMIGMSTDDAIVK